MQGRDMRREAVLRASRWWACTGHRSGMRLGFGARGELSPRARASARRLAAAVAVRLVRLRVLVVADVSLDEAVCSTHDPANCEHE